MRLPPAWAVGAAAVPPGLASPSRSRRACPPSASSRTCVRSRTGSQRYIPHAVHRQSCRELLFVFPIIPRLAHQMQYQNSHHRRSEACFRSYTNGNRPKKNFACPPESRKQKRGRTRQERLVPLCSTFAFEKWNILFLVFIGLPGQPSKNPFHFHLKNGAGSFPYSSASPRNVPLVPLFSETLYIDKKYIGERGIFYPLYYVL